MLFKSLVPFTFATLAFASPIQRLNAPPDCLDNSIGTYYCRGAVVQPLKGTHIDRTFLFKYETNPNVQTVTVAPAISFTGRAPLFHVWDPINVPDGAGTVQANITLPDDFVGEELYFWGTEIQKTTNGSTINEASAQITVLT